MTAIQRTQVAESDAFVSGEAETTDFDEINGRWDAVREFLSSDVRARSESDPDLLYRTVEANSRAAQIALFGGVVQLADTEQNRNLRSIPRGSTVANAFWWGFQIDISHEDVQAIINTVEGASSFIGAITPIVPQWIRPFLSLVKLFLDAAIPVLRALDRGNGISICMSWFTPGVMVPLTR